MSEETRTDEQAGTKDETPEPERATRPAKGRSLLLVLVAAMSLAALGVSVVTQVEIRRMDDAAAALLPKLQAGLNALEAGVADLRSAQRQLADRAETLAAELSAVQRRVESLHEKDRRTNLDWAMAEIEYLLIIATQRLALTRDVKGALAAMEAADRRLSGLTAPGLTEVRAQLASDMNALRAVKSVDLPGLSLFLADLVQRVGSFPVRDTYKASRQAEKAEEKAAPESGWRGVLQQIWHELAGLVVVKRRESGAPVTFLPEERYFLFHNLRLQLETARLAVLMRDTATLHASASIAADWLKTYFDAGDAGVASALDALKRMEGLTLDPELPSISSSLESVRAYMREREEHDDAGSEEDGTG